MRLNKRSVTILELLIVIALLAAIAAIALPYIADSLHERAFESAADVTSEQLILARAHAQATGAAVEVRYDAATAQVQARMFSPLLWSFSGIQPWSNPGFDSSNESPAAGKRSGHTSPSADRSTEPGDALVIAEPWANRSLSHGIRIVNRAPGATTINRAEDAAHAGSRQIDDAGAFSDDEEDDIRVAVFMPDGSALFGTPIWFNDDEGRIGKLTINPWTGLPMFERVSDLEEVDSSVENSVEADVRKARVDDRPRPSAISKRTAAEATRPSREQ